MATTVGSGQESSHLAGVAYAGRYNTIRDIYAAGGETV